MNRTKIEWTNHTWNPITGCDHGCWYCYAKKLFTRFHKSFKPTFHPERLAELRKPMKPSKVFVCSVSDLFAPWTPEEWRDDVLAEVFFSETPHIFQLLTKNPERIPDLEFPENVWVGTTVTTENGDVKNIEEIKRVNAKIRFVSFEPLLGPVDFHSVCLNGVQWVIVGKLTGSRKVKLDWKWVSDIIQECQYHKIPIFLKNNLGYPCPIQEFPKVAVSSPETPKELKTW